jgi:transcriptional regulator with XRE-family HTH domain
MSKNSAPLQFSGSRLREARGDRAIEEVALAAGVSVRTIANWESGSTEPDAGKLAILATTLGKPIRFFFEGAA